MKEIENYLPKVEMILVMTVEPGFGGQSLILKTLDKVAEVRAMIKEKGLRGCGSRRRNPYRQYC